MANEHGLSDVADSPWVTNGARLGYAASGLLHALLGWLTIQLVLSAHSSRADQGGAFRALSSTGSGQVILWVVIGGLVLLAFWNLLEVVVRRKLSARLKGAAKGVVYLVIAWTGFLVSQNNRAPSDSDVQRQASAVLRSPGGQLLMLALAAALFAVAGYHIYKGVRRRFLRDLREQPPSWIVRLAQIGYVAKGVTFVAVAALFTSAALRDRGAEAGGLDSALRNLLRIPLGWALVVVIGVGFWAYAAYSLARARYARV